MGQIRLTGWIWLRGKPPAARQFGGRSAIALPMDRLRFLNALRASAALWVVFAHCVLWGAFPLWYPNPQLAVDVFMILSGFLMVATVEARKDRQSLTAVKTWILFYLRRFFRLAPLYYVCLVAALLTRAWFVGGYATLFARDVQRWGGPGSHYNPAFMSFGLRSMVEHVTFVFGLSPRYVFSTLFGDWSLSLEMQFYLVFPGLLLLARRFGYGWTAVVLAGIGVLARHLAWARFVEPAPLPFLIDYFLIGMLLHDSVARDRHWLLVLSVLIVLSDWPLYGRGVLLTMSFVLVIWTFASPRTGGGRVMRLARRCMENRVCDIGADLSYGIYLLHGFLISATGLTLFRSGDFLSLPWMQQLMLMWAIVVPGSLMLGWAARMLVERPGMHLGARLCQRVEAYGGSARP